MAMVCVTERNDIKGLETVIEATGLFPPDLLEPMLNPFFGEGGDGAIWLTLSDPEPIGVLYCVPEKLTEGTWNILLIAIHPEYQNSGRGAQLMLHLESALRERRARLVIVETSGLTEFEQARAFYRKLGYAEEARIRDFYAPGDDKVVFVKAL
jgi:ribosomal protein S18 acetylase RimI-like enzyme